jgi:hypothetical protein
MALFTNLHHVGDLLVQMLEADGLSGTIQVGPPLDTVTGSAEVIRVTLLWTSPQASHRNDDWQRRQDGGLVAPPLSLSAFYLITTYGSTEIEDPVSAHRLLGEVMQVFHAKPTIAVTSPQGDGVRELSIVQVPTDADLMERLYSVLQLKHRPWVLYEVGPVQLPMLVSDAAPPRVVAPGGVHLRDLQVAGRPLLLRVTPESQVQGGRIRVDVDLRGRPLTSVLVDGVATPVGQLDTLGPAAYTLALPNGVATGSRPVRVEVGDNVIHPPRQFSEPSHIHVLDAALAPTLDAPPLGSLIVNELLLTGHNLGALQELLCWPDTKLSTPGQVVSLAFEDLQDTSVKLSSFAGLTPGTWRLSARIGAHVYTPYVLLELMS